MQHIVCYDPRNLVRPGSIVSAEHVPGLNAREVGLLPLDPADYFRGPAHGFSLRLMGDDGWRYDQNVSERGMFVPLFVREGDHQLHWYARLMPIHKQAPMSGRFKLVADASQGFMSGGVKPINDWIDTQLTPDRHGGVNLYGHSSLNLGMAGMMSLLLTGIASNVHVVALGVSIT